MIFPNASELIGIFLVSLASIVFTAGAVGYPGVDDSMFWGAYIALLGFLFIKSRSTYLAVIKVLIPLLALYFIMLKKLISLSVYPDSSGLGAIEIFGLYFLFVIYFTANVFVALFIAKKPFIKKLALISLIFSAVPLFIFWL